MKKKNILITLFALILLLSVIAVTYAYYIGGVNNDNAQTANLSTGTMNLVFADNDNGFGGAIEFGQTITKKFTIQNTGTLEASASMHWVNLVNSYRKNSLVYTLEYSETLNGSYTKIVGASVPRSQEAKKEMLAAKVTVPAGKTYYYNLNITLVDSETYDQTTDLDATFFTQFSIEKIDKVSDSYETLATLGLTYSEDEVLYWKDLATTSEYQPGTLQSRKITKDLNENNYYTYADSFKFDTFNNVYILQNFKQLKPSEITEDLTGKYLLNPSGYEEYYDGEDAGETNTLSKIVGVQDGKIVYQNYKSFSSSYGFGIYAKEDDYGTSYYFRGAPENNYVNFAGFYWRIVRINGNGTIRLLYDGTRAYENGAPANSDRLLERIPYNNATGDNAYVGYMYGTVGATSYEEAHKNTNSSNAKTYLDAWYETNIVNKGFSSYVGDAIFCNDRSVADEGGTWTSDDTALGYGSNNTYYGSYVRLNGGETPQLTCPQKHDAFTTSVDEIHGNGALTYPIGMLSSDEALLAGSRLITYFSNYSFINKNQAYYIMSPYQSYTSFSNIMYLVDGSRLFSIDVNNAGQGLNIVPVINLSKDTAKLLIGTGTMDDPYRLP